MIANRIRNVNELGFILSYIDNISSFIILLAKKVILEKQNRNGQLNIHDTIYV